MDWTTGLALLFVLCLAGYLFAALLLPEKIS